MGNDKCTDAMFIDRLMGVSREGINDLLDWLTHETDFFEAPASMNHHNNLKGGLLHHSWNVMLQYEELIDTTNPKAVIPYESAVIEALLHDICKVNCYVEDDEPATNSQVKYLTDLLVSNQKKFDSQKIKDITKSRASDLIGWLKDNPDAEPPENKINWKYDDKLLPAGHGEKSVMLIQQFIKLEPREILAIRWHMGPWEQGITLIGNKLKALRQSADMYPDIDLLHMADLQASFIEKWR